MKRLSQYAEETGGVASAHDDDVVREGAALLRRSRNGVVDDSDVDSSGNKNDRKVRQKDSRATSADSDDDALNRNAAYAEREIQRHVDERKEVFEKLVKLSRRVHKAGEEVLHM